MSRLTFVEDNEFGALDGMSDGYASSASGDDPAAQHLAESSYTIMGVEARGDSTAVKTRPTSTSTIQSDANQLTGTAWNDDDDEDEFPPPTSAGNAEISQASVVTSAVVVKSPTEATIEEEKEVIKLKKEKVGSAAKASKWLQGFLQNKRDPGSVPEKPEIIPLNDTFISQFADSTRSHLASRGINGDDVSDSGDSSNESEPDETGLSKSLYDGNLDDDDSEFDKIKLKFFNLPYNMTAEEIEDEALYFGVSIRNVEVHLDRNTKLPRGSATAELVKGQKNDDGEVLDPDSAVKALVGANFRGRPLRVERYGIVDKSNSRRSTAGSSRYFGGPLGISVKCNQCGEVGHKMAECLSEPVIPCHLCARTGHDPMDCPNLICYRCGDFGHHSKDCLSSYSVKKAILCTTCGGTTHECRGCPKKSNPNLQKVEGSGIICMICGKLGHSLCRRTARPKNRDIYCPKCGGRGHHVDFPELGRVTCYPRPRFGGRYSDIGSGGSRDLGINYNSGGGDRGSDSRNRKRRFDSSDSDDYDSYKETSNKSSSSGRSVVVEQDSNSTRRKRSRHSY